MLKGMQPCAFNSIVKCLASKFPYVNLHQYAIPTVLRDEFLFVYFAYNFKQLN